MDNHNNSQNSLLHLHVQVLRQTTRTNLSSSLNPIQLLPNASGIMRDYRGLGEVLGLTHNQMKNVERSDDPTNLILKTITSTNNNITLKNLLNALEKIERFDIIEDIMQLIFNDAHEFNKRPDSESSISTGQFDAFVCYADDDYDEVLNLVTYLEDPKVGLKLWIRHRDLEAGKMEDISILSTMASQCNRMIFICSPQFFKSPQGEFQLSFAAGLAGQEASRRLIPVIIKKCDLPPVLQMISKIDLTLGDKTPSWTWSRLVSSIKPPPTQPQIPAKSKK